MAAPQTAKQHEYYAYWTDEDAVTFDHAGFYGDDYTDFNEDEDILDFLLELVTFEFPLNYRSAGGNDTLIGDDFNNVLVGNGGADTLNGGEDEDLLVGDNFDSVSDGGNDTLDGGDGDDAVYGGGGNDSLLGGEGDDTLVGNDGNDVMQGGNGADLLSGGNGNDTYRLGSADTIEESAGQGTDTVILLAQNAYTLAANVENLVYTYTGNANLTGNGLNNLIQGGSGADTLKGGAGHDTLDGGAGNDSMVGGVGNDTYVVFNAGDKVVEAADGGYDTVRTTLTDYTLGAHVENLETIGAYGITGIGNALGNSMLGNAVTDVFYGRDGNDAISGRGGNDSLWGENGDDWMAGDAGVDWLRGGAGNDIVLGGDDMDYLYGGDGNDNLDGGTGGDVVYGEAGNDSAQGNLGNDTVQGGAGNDTLRGGEGNDRLRGDAGADQLYGDAGQDRFLYGSTADSNAAGGRDGIHGFERGVDKIDLSLIDANTNNGTGNDAFWVPGPGTVFYSEGALTFVNTLGGTRVDGDVNFDGTADLSLMVWGVWGLTASDFVL